MKQWWMNWSLHKNKSEEENKIWTHESGVRSWWEGKEVQSFFFLFLVNEDINPRAVREGMVCEMRVDDLGGGAEKLIWPAS